MVVGFDFDFRGKNGIASNRTVQIIIRLNESQSACLAPRSGNPDLRMLASPTPSLNLIHFMCYDLFCFFTTVGKWIGLLLVPATGRSALIYGGLHPTIFRFQVMSCCRRA
jgi:hypothetical protein